MVEGSGPGRPNNLRILQMDPEQGTKGYTVFQYFRQQKYFLVPADAEEGREGGEDLAQPEGDGEQAVHAVQRGGGRGGVLVAS